LPMETGYQVLLGVGWSCNTAPDYYSYSSDLVTDYGIGTWAGYRSFDPSFDSAGEAFEPTSTVTASYLYRQRVFVTKLQ